jgi:hypothetical protein
MGGQTEVLKLRRKSIRPIRLTKLSRTSTNIRVVTSHVNGVESIPFIHTTHLRTHFDKEVHNSTDAMFAAVNTVLASGSLATCFRSTTTQLCSDSGLSWIGICSASSTSSHHAGLAIAKPLSGGAANCREAYSSMSTTHNRTL